MRAFPKFGEIKCFFFLFLQVDPVKLGPVSVITTMRQPASTLLAATQHDSLLHMIDCRTGIFSKKYSSMSQNIFWTGSNKKNPNILQEVLSMT